MTYQLALPYHRRYTTQKITVVFYHDRFDQISLSFPQSRWLILPVHIISGAQHASYWTAMADEFKISSLRQPQNLPPRQTSNRFRRREA